MLPPSGDEATSSDNESKRYHRWLFVFYLVALLIPFTAAALALRTKHDLLAVVAVLTAIFPLAHAGGVTRREDRLVVMRQLQVFLLALLTAAGAASLALWLTAGAVDDNVTGDSDLTLSTGLGHGATTELRVGGRPLLHDELSVVLAVKDGTGGHSPCISLGSLEFGGDDLAKSVPAPLDDEVSVTLPLDVVGPRVSVEIKVTAPRGCRLTLGTEEVSYR